jgi:hypothetical protein
MTKHIVENSLDPASLPEHHYRAATICKVAQLLASDHLTTLLGPIRPLNAAHEQRANSHKRQTLTVTCVRHLQHRTRIGRKYIEPGLVHRLWVHGVILAWDMLDATEDCVRGRVEAVVVGGREAEDGDARWGVRPCLSLGRGGVKVE